MDNSNNSKKSLDLILYSKTIKEIELADAILTYFSITHKIMFEEDVSSFDKDNNFFISLFTDIISALINDDKKMLNRIKTSLYEYSNSKKNPLIHASIIYDLSVFGALYDIKEIIAEKCKFDISDVENEFKFITYFYEAKDLQEQSMKGKTVDLNSIENNEEVDFFIEMIKEYKNIYKHRFDNKDKIKIKLY